MKSRLFVTSLIVLYSNFFIAQIIGKQKCKDFYQQTLSAPFCIKNNDANRNIIEKAGKIIKHENDKWLYFSANGPELSKLFPNGDGEIYFNTSKGMSLADSAIVRHKINLVHQGQMLDTSYTGKGVILGIVDQGLDYNHPDFLNPDGSTRVLRYWDHTISSPAVFDYYGYGVLWDNNAINTGNCTSNEIGTGHGTTVAGIAGGNGSANGKNKGAAPESDLVIVETNFNLPNWTLTIADACDYIFKLADSLDKPAVINLSLGSYLGSHDGLDPAALQIDNLLDETNGRIVVCAAGNSGDEIPYHVHNDINQDTTFFWNINNPGNTYVGNNKILIDFWTDTLQANYQFSYGADRPGPSYGFVGRTSPRNALDNVNNEVVYDTIYNGSGERLACIETWRTIEDSRLHMQTIFWVIDSLDYLFRFEAYGEGSFDAWGGAWQLLSDFVTTIPSDSVMANIVHYRMPDSLQSIVTSWACSEKVITVGNSKNRDSYIDNNGNLQEINNGTVAGELAKSSSKGPSRMGIIKPDVTSSGDISFGSGPFWLLNDPANNSIIEEGGFHVRNGGTSMASPVVAGTAALFLQKCKNANYTDFKSALMNTSSSDIFTGFTPNNAYGYGKLDAHELILQNHAPVSITGPDGICSGDIITLGYNTSLSPSEILWNNGAQSSNITISQAGTYQVCLTDDLGCKNRSNVKVVSSYALPIVDAGPNRIECPGEEISFQASGTASDYLWSNGVANNESFIPDEIGYYSVIGTNANGCQAEDSCFLDFYTLMDVSYNEVNTTVALNSLAFNLIEGIPSGGIYEGNGVIGTSFHPGLAGVGEHEVVYAIVNNNGCFSRDTSIITVYQDASVAENSFDFSVFPNPARETFHIQSSHDGVITIYNMAGKIVYIKNIYEGAAITLSNLNPGMYSLVFENELYSINKKLTLLY